MSLQTRVSTRGSVPTTTTAFLFTLVVGLLVFAMWH
jgi:hypothetical protein